MVADTAMIRFSGALGSPLAARLDLPSGHPVAFALFAHCFTCSKDSLAASRISGALTAHRIGVLRFDFTGLGGSEGDFANTNFSSNIADLIAAADWLGQHHQAPQILIGHSLGGAAVLAAFGLAGILCAAIVRFLSYRPHQRRHQIIASHAQASFAPETCSLPRFGS